MKTCNVCHATYPNDFSACPKDQAMLTEVNELSEGMIIREKFQILRKIGAGPMAAVYVAKNLTFGETRALKIVHNKFAKNEAFVNLLKTEGVPRKLEHENAARVEDFDFAEDDSPFLVIEYVEGKTLRSVLKESGALDPTRAVAIGTQILAALDAAHTAGVLHLDVKPENIMLVTGANGEEQVKVLDFGMARVKEGSVELFPMYGTTTKSGIVVGTPQYLSPEQALGKKGNDLDGRSDLYSTGVLLYEMLTGQLPFSSATNVGMLVQHITGTPKPPLELKPDLPQPLSDVVMKALQKDRNNRYATGNAMAEDLGATLPKKTSTKPGATVMIKFESSTPQPRARSAAAVAAALAKAPTPPPGAIEAPRLRTSAVESADSKKKEAAPAKASAPSFGEVDDSASSSSNMPIMVAVAALVIIVGGAAFFMSRGKHPAPQTQTQASQQDLQSEHKAADAKLLVDVQGLLATSPSYSGLNATVENGLVTVAGKVETKQDLDRATSIVRNTIGVKDVVNTGIEIDPKFGKKEQQAALAARVKNPPRPAPVAAQPASTASSKPAPAATPTGTSTAATATPAPAAPVLNPAQQKARSLIAMGNRQLDAGDYQSATNMFNTALSLDPGNAAATAGLQRANEAIKKGH